MKIRKLHIHRMPGFPRGLKGFDKLAGNVNVVAGPNGSGKSSTARVIQKLIWWNHKTTGYQINAEVDVQEEQNRIEIDSQSYIRTDSRKKTQEDFSYISPAEFSNQYMLALHDLVRDNDDNLASIIAREVNGGVDLRQAGDNLGYKHSTPTLNNSYYREYELANKLYSDYEKEQAGILRDEDSLVALEEDKKQSEEAFRLKDWYERVLHYLQSKERYDVITARLQQYPQSMTKMKEDDLKMVENLEHRIYEIDLSLAESANIIETNKEKISKLRIPGNEEIPDEYLYELTERISRLKELNSTITTCEREIAKQQVSRENTEKYINSENEFSVLRKLNLEHTHNLSEFIRKANEATGNQYNLLDRKEVLENELTSINNKLHLTTASTTDLIKGISFLSDWLKIKKADGKTNSSRELWLLPAWGIFAAIAGFYGGLAGIILVLIISLCLIPVMLMQKKKANPVQTDDLTARSSYQKLNLSFPSAWESEEVTIKIQELVNELELHNQKNGLEDKIRQLNFEIEKNRIKLNEIDSQYAKYKLNMGVLPDKLEELTDNYNSFYVFLCNLMKWQEAIIEQEKLETGKQAYTVQYTCELDEINQLLKTMNFSTIDNPEQASSRLQTITKEKEIRKDALNEIAGQNRIIILRQQEKVSCQEALREIYERIGIISGEKHEIQLLNNQYQTFIKVQEELNQEQGNLNANFKLLQNHSLYEEYKDMLVSLTTDEVLIKIREYEFQADKQEGLSQKLAEIRAQIKEKKSRNDIEIALNKKEEALTGLGELLKSSLKSVTGGMIISGLHEEISLNNDNRIFKQANKILGSITKGRYSLILSEGLQPTFLALDNVLNSVQSLTEISTGTRVQLLLAIRLAYIESQENTVRLPLLADELLANSDDERSEAIIRSLIEISRNRQLFYFTAQADEVEKWKHYLQANPDLDSEIILLGNKIIEYDKVTPAIQPIILSQYICSPAGFDHQSYGKQIGVPPFNMLEQGISEIHLWYLIEDINLLYSCLQHGFYQWGQLNSFLENGGRISGMDENILQNLKNKIIIFSRFKELYCSGRPRNINRDVLIASQAVTEAYLDKISELLTEKEYNPDELLEALDSGAIKGFRANKKEELRIYLLEKNYISTIQPYSEEDIHIKISALISNMDIERSEAEQFINRFIDK